MTDCTRGVATDIGEQNVSGETHRSKREIAVVNAGLWRKPVPQSTALVRQVERRSSGHTRARSICSLEDQRSCSNEERDARSNRLIPLGPVAQPGLRISPA
jgi:hypothetical protein